MKRPIIAVLLLASCSAWGGDSEGRYSGRGIGCGEFIQDVRNNRTLQCSAWFAGYITAFNRQTADTYNILAGTDLPGVRLWMENYCKQNPLKDIDDGMRQLTSELYPRRHRTARDAGN